MPTLDARLNAVLELINADCHADIGSDHAALPIELVRAGRIKRGVIVELNPGPLHNARRGVALAGLNTVLDVRQGDGFGPLAPGEVQSASITGMGAATILKILRAAPEKLPSALVLQPNDSPRPLREWARENAPQSGYHIAAEALAPGYWAYPVLRLEKGVGDDPAYADFGAGGLSLDAALRYGPRLLRSGSPLLRRQVWADVVRLTPLSAPGRPAERELAGAKAALDWLGGCFDLLPVGLPEERALPDKG